MRQIQNSASVSLLEQNQVGLRCRAVAFEDKEQE